MKSFAISKRYSTALWGVAGTSANAEKILESLEALNSLIRDSRELSKFLTTPLFSFEKKWAATLDVLEKINATKEVRSFVRQVMKAGRISLFQQIVEAFRHKVLLEKGVLEVLVESALPLNETQKQELVARLEKATGKKILIEEKTVASLLGGMSVSYGGRTYDGSLRTHLKNLEKHLLKEDFVYATA